MKLEEIKNIIYEELQIPEEIKLGEMKVSLLDLEKIVDKISSRLEALVGVPSEPSFGQWIDVKEKIPVYIKYSDGSEADNSEKVFTKDKNGNLYVMELWYERDADGWLWANCYGDINGDAEIDDDDYAEIITHWMPLPKP